MVGTIIGTRELQTSLVVLDSRCREDLARTYQLKPPLLKYQPGEATLEFLLRDNQ